MLIVPLAFTIRRAELDDAAAICDIASASPTAGQWTRQTYDSAIQSAARLVLVAMAGDQIAGFVVASTASPEWELENIAVAASSRRQGVGRRLMEALIEHARQAGACEIRQEIRASNLAAQRLGQVIGFRQQGKRPAYYRDPQEDALLFNYLLCQPK
ncbi:MAG: ribosomal protein S18-alanine N-acetyltransferase [Acidobacteria bacterium]|nr:ribosomal protein S18-alanine N-acetyltransferase [Acidobacteriota bacterium]MBV9145101.1 ribosomal protein S18-alanine N-acetyltransferase [Acidobacteriota bacterium]MBV9434430.1 ribosomal protein S18-alanine N-acetyltransferase [Acidobacteriota bacterium]